MDASGYATLMEQYAEAAHATNVWGIPGVCLFVLGFATIVIAAGRREVTSKRRFHTTLGIGVILLAATIGSMNMSNKFSSESTTARQTILKNVEEDLMAKYRVAEVELTRDESWELVKEGRAKATLYVENGSTTQATIALREKTGLKLYIDNNSEFANASALER